MTVSSVAAPIPTAPVGPSPEPVRAAAVRSLRTLAVCVLGGVAVGIVVGGVGGRLAMMLLAVLNPDATGRISDDGFRIGQLTASGTFNLLLVGGLLGAFGGAIYAVLRPLLVGPRWFQVASISIGPAVVVGAMLVHVDGVDFRILDPTWLSISLFVLIPGLYAGAVTLLVERWLEPGAWPERAHPVVAYGPLLAILPFAPVAPLLALGWAGVQGVRRSGLGAAALTSPFPRWLGRAALTIVFLVAARDLLQDISTLT